MILLTALLVSGCATRDYKELTKQVAEYGLQTYEDKKHNVLCYIYRDDDSNSMFCFEKGSK